jgi:hypothetical protein
MGISPDVLALLGSMEHAASAAQEEAARLSLQIRELEAIIITETATWRPLDDVATLRIGLVYCVRRAWGKRYISELSLDPPCLARWTKEGWVSLFGNLTRTTVERSWLEVLVADDVATESARVRNEPMPSPKLES